MNDPTITLIHLALDASLMRQTAIAHNIANKNTLDYQPIDVNFEQQLAQNAGFLDFNNDPNAFFQVSEAPSSIDEQIALSVKNATHYRALIKGLNHKLALLRLALHGSN